jgi:hypothetical protein
MKKVYEHIGRRSETFAGEPLFSYLRDESIDPAQRLRFIPFMSHFVMAFADLYNVVLPEEAGSDRNLDLVNAHLREDSEHWKWFLADLANANLDPELRFTDSLRFVWSDQTVATRLLSYRICQLSGGLESSTQKLVMINCIEATGKIALQALAVAGTALERKVGRKLVYFGGHHVETETHHTLEGDDVRESIEEVVLTDDDRRAAIALVDKTFVLFENAVSEMNRVARSGGGLGPSSRPVRGGDGTSKGAGRGEVDHV